MAASPALDFPPRRAALGVARSVARANFARLAVLAALVLLTAIGLGIRLSNLASSRGDLGVDEARLVLVGRGWLEHGWPVLPSGKVYTRGLVQSVLTAASLAAIGPLDLAAKLPSTLSGAVLAPVLFLYGRQLGGPLAGLAAGVLAATSVPLVLWSREAWLYAEWVLLWMAALWLLDRALARGSRRALVLAGAAVGLGLLAHELTAFLLPAVGAGLVLWLRVGRDAGRVRATAAASVPITLALAAQVAFSLRLRADTVGGAGGELAKYLEHAEDLDGLRVYVVQPLLADWHWLLVLCALVGLCLARPAARSRLLLLFGSALPLLAAICWTAEHTERYGLVLIPTLFVLAGAGLAELYRRLTAHGRAAGALVGAGLAAAILAAQVDSAWLQRTTRVERSGEFWLDALREQGYRPDDLLLTDVPTITTAYLGRTDGWLRTANYDKYTWIGADGRLRDIHSGGLLIRTAEEFERLVRAPNRGRRAWIVSSNFGRQWSDWVDRGLRDYIQAEASIRRVAADKKRVFMIRL